MNIPAQFAGTGPTSLARANTAAIFSPPIFSRISRCILALMLLSLAILGGATSPVRAATSGEIHFYPRPGSPGRMTGGIFQGSSDGTTYTNLYTISSQPLDSTWTTVTLSVDPKSYRYLRYLSPAGSYGNVADIAFYSGTGAGAVKIGGFGFGTAGSFNNSGNTFTKAIDGNINSYFDGASANGNYVGIDQGAAVTGPGKVRFYPRLGSPDRMVGGKFQGSNDNSTYTDLYTITGFPTDGVTLEVGLSVDPKSYRYLRYLSPAGSYGNVAEIAFYSGTDANAVQVTGVGFGTAGSFNNSGNDFTKALDGNTATFFDGASANGNLVGIDQGAGVTPDFSVSTSPTSLSVPQGTSVSTTVSLTNTGGFSSSVALTVSGVPAGVSAVLLPATISGTVASTLTLMASPTAATGTTTITITGTSGTTTHTATLSLTVTSNPILTSITVSPATASLNLNGTQTFTATAKDQFGNALTTQPSFTWSVDSGGVGSINLSTGQYTAGSTAGSATVRATSGSVSGTTAVTVTNAAPTVATAALATPSPITATTTTLSVLGADDGGEPALTYTWATIGTPPAAVTFSANGTNAAKTTTATFTKAGSYSFQVTIKDAGNLSVTSSVTVTVNQTLTSITVAPTSASLNLNGAQTFTATATDQFGTALATQPTIVWSVDSGGAGGSVTPSGQYTAGSTAGSATVRATSGTISGTASVTITSLAPAVSNLTLSPTSVMGGGTSVGTVTLSAPALPGGTVVTLSSNSASASVPATVTIAAGSSAATFPITTTTAAVATITAVTSGTPIQASLTIQSPNIPGSTSLSVTAFSGYVNLQWNAVANAVSYNVYRSTTSGGEGATPIATNITGVSGSLTVSDYDGYNNGLANLPSGTYYYQVTAVSSGGGEGLKSNEASASPSATYYQTILPAPQVKVVAGTTQATLTWSAVPGAVSYNIYRSMGNYSSFILYQRGSSATTLTDTGLTTNSSYTYYVCAVNVNGQGTQSSYVTTIPGSAILPVTSLSATANSGYVNLQWNAVANAQTYNVYRSTTSGGEGATPIATNIPGVSGSLMASYSDGYNGGLANLPSGTYYYQVTAVSSGGEGLKSNEASATPSTTYNQTILPAPKAKVVAGSTQATLTWSAVPGAVSYNVYRSVGNYSSFTLYQTGSSATTLTDTGLTTNSQYTYYVCAVNVNGQGTQSSYVTAIPGSAILPATNLAVTYYYNNQLSLSWNAVSGVYSYNIYRSTSSNGEGAAPYLTNISGTGYLDPNSGSLQNSQTYYYQVVAVGPGGEGAFSNEASGTSTVNSTVLPAPKLKVVAGSTQATLNWGAVPGAVSYNIYRIVGNQYPATLYQVGSSATTLTDTGLTTNSSYTYYVCAVNVIGQGTASNQVTAIPGSAILPATNLAVTYYYNNQLSLSWNAVSGVYSYNIYRSTSSNGEGAVPYLTNITTPGYIDPNSGYGSLQNGQTYYYQVTAVGPGGEGAFSNEASGTSTVNSTVLPAPTLTGAPLTYGGVTLNWSAVSGATGGYNLYRTLSGTATTTLLAVGLTSTSYTDTTAGPGTFYYYVCAVNTAGQGALSTPYLYLTPNDFSLLVTPSPLTVGVGSTGVGDIAISRSGTLTSTPVNLSLSGTLPSGVTASFFPQSPDHTGSSVYFCVGAGTAPGTYNMTLIGSVPGSPTSPLSRSIPITLIVTSP